MMTAVRKDDIARMRDQRQRREAIEAARRPLAVRRLQQQLLWGTLTIDPREDAAAVSGLPAPHTLPWGAKASLQPEAGGVVMASTPGGISLDRFCKAKSFPIDSKPSK